MKYFKVHLGYEQFVPITEEELDKALMAQITGKVAVFENGAVRGSSITLIGPDYPRALGYYEGYKFIAEDWAEIKNKRGDYIKFITGARDRTLNLIAQGKTEMLKKPRQKKMALPPPTYEIDEAARLDSIIKEKP